MAFLRELEDTSHESYSKMRKMWFSSAIHEHPRLSLLFLPQLRLRNGFHRVSVNRKLERKHLEANKLLHFRSTWIMV